MMLKTHLHFGIVIIILLTENTLYAQNPPMISNFLNNDISNHVLKLQSGISLKCEGRGRPEPEYKWFHNNEEIVPDDIEGCGDEDSDWERELTNSNKVIKFSEDKDAYIGWYYCEAKG